MKTKFLVIHFLLLMVPILLCRQEIEEKLLCKKWIIDV